MMLKPKILLSAFGVYVGIGLYFFSVYDGPILEVLRTNGLKIIGLFVSFISFLFMYTEMNKAKKKYREERFIDVDTRRRESLTSSEAELILEEINEIKTNQAPFDYEKIIKLINESKKESARHSKEIYSSFENYFNSIRNLLEEKSRVADEKASILLDKGTSYSKGGITFFIISIVAWQILSWFGGFKEQYVYGIVSCSLLFIFIEFLSAWFLKQYRHFVDTSTYLIKVKSIFDRYMLSYLTVQNLSSDDDDSTSKYQSILTLLTEDIKWPETYLLKNGDISFAKEALDTMTHFAKVIRSESQKKPESSQAS